jgi:AcrR family transcriptional regulator
MSIAYDVAMSPAPARTSTDAIVTAARRILERDGLAGLTMRSVAEAVGVRGPSLYKRLPDREALLRAVADSVVADLARTMSKAAGTDDPAADVRTAVLDYRTFVQRNPNGYRLLFTDLPSGARPDPAILAALGEPLVAAMTRLAGESGALEAARTVVAWAHGFLTMELAGAFRLGGDLEIAYLFGIETILAGVSERATPASR